VILYHTTPFGITERAARSVARAESARQRVLGWLAAGLEEVTSGTISIDGDRGNDVEPRHKDIAMVFQSYALYPHLSVYENMAFSLKYRKIAKSEIKRRVAEAARILELAPYLERKPRQLSGGQRQ
jgi:multiple sugar transport system ATP-binding protein